MIDSHVSEMNAAACWGGELSGTPCSQPHVPTGNHMQSKFCSVCTEVGVLIPTCKIRALHPHQHAEYSNGHGRSPWSTDGCRVVNHTKRCHGPHLILFKHEPPPSHIKSSWAPLPPEWLCTDAQGATFVRLRIKNGTLTPESPATSQAPPCLPPPLAAAPSGAIAAVMPILKRERDDSSTSDGGDGSDGSFSGRSSESGAIACAPIALATPLDSSLSGTVSPTPSMTSAVAATVIAVPSVAAVPVSAAPANAVPVSAVPANAVPVSAIAHPFSFGPPSSLPPPAPPPSAEPPSAHSLWYAFAQLDRMVRARLAYDHSGQVLPGQVLPGQVLPPAAPALHQARPLQDMLPAIQMSAARLVHDQPAVQALPPQNLQPQGLPPHAVQPQDLQPFTQQPQNLQPFTQQPVVWAQPPPPSVKPLPAAVSSVPPAAMGSSPSMPLPLGAIEPDQAAESPAAAAAESEDAFVAAQLDSSYVDSWLEMISTVQPSPPTSPPDVTRVDGTKGDTERGTGADTDRGRTASLAAQVASFLGLWWRELTPSPVLPTKSSTLQFSAPAASARASCLSAWLPCHLQELPPVSKMLVIVFPVCLSSLASAIVVFDPAADDWVASSFEGYLQAFFAVFLLLILFGQRFVHLVTGLVWLDALCQLAMCLLLSRDLQMELHADMQTPDSTFNLRVVSASSGVLFALLPRSTRWKLSLFVAHLLVVAVVAVNAAVLLRTFVPLLTFAIDSSMFFLIAFGVVELSARGVQHSRLVTRV